MFSVKFLLYILLYMKLEAIVISVNYGDFLSNTLPYNKHLFDKIVVVTDTTDEHTKKICEFWNVQCVQTDDFYLDDPKIANKSRGINVGLQHLSKDGWIVQLDADIWLPTLTREILEKYPLDNKSIYGIDRLMCNSYNDWYNFLHRNPKSIHEGWIYLHTDIFHIGTRIVQYHSDGYMPIGFFQLWNPKGSGVYTYPTEKSGYDRTDVVHLKQWKRENRKFIPDLLCVHLASEDHRMGQNWFGRNTQTFGPNPEKISIFTKINNFFRMVHFLLKEKYVFKELVEKIKIQFSLIFK